MATRTGIEIIRQDSEETVLMRCLIAILENRLGTHRVTIGAGELEALRGQRAVTVEGEQGSVTVVVMTAEDAARVLKRRHVDVEFSMPEQDRDSYVNEPRRPPSREGGQ